MPLLYIAVIDLCFILDVVVPLICALTTAVYRILTFLEKHFDQRETRHVTLADSEKVSHVTSTSQGQKFQKFEEYPKSVRIKMADLAGR